MTVPAPLSTLPVRAFGGTVSPASGILSLPEVEQILFVDEGSNPAVGATGSRQRPFQSVGAAITAANALTPTATNRVLIWILPGYYQESLTAADDYVYFAGTDRDACWAGLVPGAGWSITADITGFWNLTLFGGRAAGEGVAAPGIEIDVAATSVIEFHECTIVGRVDATVIETKGGALSRFVDCSILGSGTFVAIDQTGASTETTLIGTTVNGTISIQAGDGTFERCNLTAVTWLSAGDLEVRNSYIANASRDAIGLNAQPNSALIVGNDLNGGAGNYDVGSSLQLVTGIIVENNIMRKGIEDSVSTASPKKYVGSEGDKDWYGSLQEAFNAVNEDECTVYLLQDETVTAAVSVTVLDVTLDGLGHSLSRATGDVITLPAGADLTTRNIEILGNIEMTGNATLLTLSNDTLVTGRVEVASGDSSSKLTVSHAEIAGTTTWGEAILISDADPEIVILHSYVHGFTGNEAILWDADNDNVKVSFSTIMHGTPGGAANYPYVASGAFAIDHAAHNTAFNLDPDAFVGAAAWTNSIAGAQQQNTITPNADY